LKLFAPLGDFPRPPAPVPVNSWAQTTSIRPVTREASIQTKPQAVNAETQTDEPVLAYYDGELVNIQPVEKSDQGTEYQIPGTYNTRGNSFQSAIPVWIKTPIEKKEGVDKFTGRPLKSQGTHTHTHTHNTHTHTATKSSPSTLPKYSSSNTPPPKAKTWWTHSR
jgi:hypothetical protein